MHDTIIPMKNMDDYYKQFEQCRQKEEPACTNVCPFHLNVLDFQDKVKRHKYDRAYKDLKNAMCFPEVVASLCPEYCNQVCPRKDFDGAVQLNLLERTCIAKAKRKEPTSYNVPKKEGKVGIIGGGVSGLACALKLLEKKYEVVVFEREDKVGGQLKGLLPEDVYMSEIELQFSKEKYELKTDTEIKALSDLDEYGFSCIYVATGTNGNDFGIMSSENEDLKSDEHYMFYGDIPVIAGGSLTDKDVVKSIAHGIEMSWVIEVFLKTNKIEYNGEHRPTKVVPDTDKFAPSKPVTPTEDGIFSEEETETEAGRCIRCQCDACRTYCDIVEFHNQWPNSMREDVAMTVMPSESMIHKTPAVRLINTCTQCGLFEEMCPPNIEMGDMMLEARKHLHKQHIMPPAFHGFWLDDMEHANSSLSKICRNAPGKEKSTYAYFPGCNLGAADPKYIEKSYKWLIENFDDMGLLLRCCGVPVDWAGNEERHNKEIDQLREDWQSLGKPVLVTACPTCSKHILEYLPEIETISVYELMWENKKWPDTKTKNTHAGSSINEFSLFDPCAARNNEGLESAVRKAIEQTGLKVSDLPMKNKYGCCGFGGNVEVANPKFADFVAKKRASLSENPYITYCINCRDVFVGEQKPVLHMFDILFGINDINVKPPSLTERRWNRLDLKKILLKEIWGEDMAEKEKIYPFEIVLDADIKDKMEILQLVDTDVKDVIEASNKIGRRTYDKETDEYICYAKLNYITCWVRYKQNKNVYHITNLYTHRMDIELEAVWNGQKIDAHM